jgi:hypothetical protein
LRRRAAVDEAKLTPAAPVRSESTDGLANQGLEHRREEAEVRRDHRLELAVVEDVLLAQHGQATS